MAKQKKSVLNKVLFFAMLLFLLQRLAVADSDTIPNAAKPSEDFETTKLPDTSDKYPGSKFKGNYIHAGAINLVWNELKQNIAGENLKLRTDDRKVLHFVRIMNTYPFGRRDLDSSSYYIKSGCGQDVVDLINREVTAKFPDKTFPPLDLKLGPADLLAYAYIYKNVKYANKFEPLPNFYFDKEHVKGFYAKDKLQKSTVKIIHYWTRDKFIIKLVLKGNADELILAKGFNQENPIRVMNAIKMEDLTQTTDLGEYDAFGMPELHFDYEHLFDDLKNKGFDNAKLKTFRIQGFLEWVKFDLDYNGIRLENKAEVALCTGARPKFNKILYLDKPFWLVMKRKNRTNPYLVLGVNNSEIMTKSQSR